MSDFDKKASRTRASIIVLIEQALSSMGANFVKLGEALRNDEKDAEDRAEYLQSEEARLIWSTVWHSDVLALNKILGEFDKIVEKTATAPYRIDVNMRDSSSYGHSTDLCKVEHVKGHPAELSKHLVKAGFKVTTEATVGSHFDIVISRP